MTSVSNPGAKKGRGRGAGRIRIRDLNRGQMIGVGKINMLWPGLSAPVIRGRELLKQQRLPDDPERYSLRSVGLIAPNVHNTLFINFAKFQITKGS